MFQRFLSGIKNCNRILSVFDNINNINNGHLVKLLDISHRNVATLKDSGNLIQNFNQNIYNRPLNELNSLVKLSLYNKHGLGDSIYDGILTNLLKNYENDRILSLDTMYHLLLNSSYNPPSAKCVDFLDKFRLSSDSEEQLKLLYIFYSIQFYHSQIQNDYTPQLKNFVEYLKLLSPKIRLNCGITEESEEVSEVKKTLDQLNQEYLSAITGHIYSPIVLKRTNMAIDVCYERERYQETDNLDPVTSLRELMMRDMGWKIRFIPVEDWRCNKSDEEKRKYLSRFISKYYLDTQFCKNPPWVVL